MPTQQFSTPHPVRVAITVPAGNIQIATTDADQSTVTLEGSQRVIDSMRVELMGDRLVIDQRRKSLISVFDRIDESLRVEVHVPRDSAVEIVTASADATLSGEFGALEVKSASGGVEASGVIGGNATLKTVSGDLRLPRVTGDLNARSVSAEVVADSVEGSVSVKSVSGSVRVGSVREGQVNVQSVSGDVDLGIASGTSVDVDAGSASGALSSEVPLADTPGDDPGPIVVVRSNTVSGDFHLHRAA